MSTLPSHSHSSTPTAKRRRLTVVGLCAAAIAGLALLLAGAMNAPALAQAPDPGADEPQLDNPNGPAPPLAGPPGAHGPSGNAGVHGGAKKPPLPYHKRVLTDPPKSPRERAEVLSNLYAQLATAPNNQTGSEIASVIERFWLLGHGDTVFVLMQRATKALAEGNKELALKFLDAVVDLAPDYAEGWHQRAVVNYTDNNFASALGDLRRVLALDANHYKALEGLSRMLEETGNAAGALAAHRQLMDVNPFWPNAEDRLRELELKSEGQGI